MPLKHLSETQVREIIARATALNLAFPESEDGIEMHDPKAMQEVSTYLGSPECASLDRALRDLSDDGRFELIALMWLGRGDSGNDFGASVKKASTRRSSGTGAVQNHPFSTASTVVSPAPRPIGRAQP